MEYATAILLLFAPSIAQSWGTIQQIDMANIRLCLMVRPEYNQYKMCTIAVCTVNYELRHFSKPINDTFGEEGCLKYVPTVPTWTFLSNIGDKKIFTRV